MKNPKYQLYTGSNKKVYFRLKSGNGQIVLQSQGYKSKASAKAGIASVKTHARSVKNFEVKQARNGKFHFNLISKNKQVIGSSQMYTEKRGCTGGMSAVKKNVSSPIEDLSK